MHQLRSSQLTKQRQLQADLGRWTTGLQVTAVARSGRAMRHGLAGCFTPGTGLWAGRLHSDWSSDRHRVPRPSQIDPLLPFAVPPKTCCAGKPRFGMKHSPTALLSGGRPSLGSGLSPFGRSSRSPARSVRQTERSGSKRTILKVDDSEQRCLFLVVTVAVFPF